MKEIALTQGKFALVDDEDFEELNKFKWHTHKGGNTYYATKNMRINGKQKTIRMHRLIMGVTDRKIQIDHKYGNGLDNRKINLRVCTRSENQRNQKKILNTSSIYKGVCWDKEYHKWMAGLGYNGRSIKIGRFINEKDAAKAYNLKATELFGDFARLNRF